MNIITILERLCMAKKLKLLLKKDFIRNKLLINLAKNDLKAKFSSSLFGVVWAVFMPLTTILVLWFVFQVGLRSTATSDVPFIIWLMPAYISWSFINEALSSSSNSIIEYSYLVKKINFDVKIIPIVKITSAAIIHIIFIGLIIGINLLYAVFPTIYSWQVIYYFFALISLLVGLTWLISALVPFVPDVANIVGVILQIGFWATPIVWDSSILSPSVKLIIQLNPFYYICLGYRSAFTEEVWFWELGWINIYYWVVVLLFFVLGSNIFKKMRPHFADVL